MKTISSKKRRDYNEVWSINDISVTDAGSSNITRLPILMHTACWGCLLDRRRRQREGNEGKEYPIHNERSTMRFGALTTTQLLMQVALTLQDYQYLSLQHVGSLPIR
jgi:hypothetical protein